MARTEARIFTGVWEDPDFRALSGSAQRTYMLLFSQPDIAHDGVIALRERRWSRTAADLTPNSVAADLDELERARFVVVDVESEEVLIRAFIRRDGVYRQPNVLLAARKHLPLVASARIRTVIAGELRRVFAADDINDRCKAIVRGMLEDLTEPVETPSLNPSANPSDIPSTETAAGKVDNTVMSTWVDQSPPDDIYEDRASNKVSAAQNPSENPSPKPSGNPSPNPSANPTRSTLGEGGVVRTVSSDAPIPTATQQPPDPPPNPSPYPAAARRLLLQALETEACTADEADAIAELVTRERRPRNLAAVLRTIADAGELPQLLDDVRTQRTCTDQAAKQRDQAAKRATERAETARLAIAACTDCDQRGYLPNGRPCPHDPASTDRVRRGAAAARAALMAKALN